MIRTAFIVLTMVIFLFPLNTFGAGCSSNAQGATKSGGCALNIQAILAKGTCQEGDCENGRGVMLRTDGTKYKGLFKDGLPHGKGTFVYPKMEAAKKGTYTFRSSGTYEGDVKRGLKEGQGTFTFLSGTKYVGQFQDDERKGKGVITMSNGVIYEGEFDRGMPHGKGMIKFPEGKKYVGEIDYNHIKGKGEMTFPDGRKYAGMFARNKMNGQGVMTYPDGKKEEGFFSDDKFMGKKPLTKNLNKLSKAESNIKASSLRKDKSKPESDMERMRRCAQKVGIGMQQETDNYMKMKPEQFIKQMKKEKQLIPLEKLQKQFGTNVLPKKMNKD